MKLLDPRLAAALFCVCLVSACDFLLGEDDVSGQVAEPGVIQSYSDGPSIQLPADASAGIPFDVVVSTYGNGCVSKGFTRSLVVGMAASVEPMDSVYHAGPGEACTDIGKTFMHRATITFPVPGPAEVIVRGIQRPGNRMIEVRRSIEVH